MLVAAPGIIPAHGGSERPGAAAVPVGPVEAAVSAPRWTGPRGPLMLQAMTPLRRLLGLLAFAVTPAVLMMPAGAVLLAQTAAPAAAAGDTVPGESGIFIIRHAGDTVATERFSRTATTLHGTLAIRNAKGTLQAYQAVVAPDASVPLIEVTVREIQDSGRTNGQDPAARAGHLQGGQRGGGRHQGSRGIQTRVFGTERGAVPYLNLCFALLEQAVRRWRAAAPVSSRGAVLQPRRRADGGRQGLEARCRLAFDRDRKRGVPSQGGRGGRVLGGTIPAQQLVAERVAGS